MHKICGKHFDIEFIEADHITPWKEGGRTVEEITLFYNNNYFRRKWPL